MTMHNIDAFRLSIATASELPLTVLAGSKDRVRSFANPRLIGFNAFSANCQYGALVSPESFPGASDPPVRVVGDVKAAYLLDHLHELPPMPLVPTGTLVVRGYQDSGGAEVVDATLETVHDIGQSIDPKNPPKGRLRVVRITSAGNMTATAWTSYGTGANAFQGQHNKKYAILGVCAYSANTIAVRFEHPSFHGLNPGKRGTSDVALGYARFEHFAPVFDGDVELEIQGLASAAEAQICVLYLWEMD